MKRRYYCLIFFIIYFIILSYSIGFEYRNIIDGGDTDIPLDPKMSMDKFFTVWNNDGTGIALPIPGIWVIHSIPLYLLLSVFGKISSSSLIYFVILFSLAPISMFLLISELTQKNNILSFFISIFYSFNLYTAIEFHAPVFHMLYIFGIIPLLIFLFIRILKTTGKKKIFFIIIYSILFLPLIRIFQMFLILMFIVPLFSNIITRDIKRQDFIKPFVLSLLIILLISLPFIIGIIQNIGWTKNPENQMYVKLSMNTAKESNITDSLRLIGTYAWKTRLYDEFPGIQAFSFAQYYQENPFYMVMSYYVIILPIFTFIILRRRLEKQEILEICKIFVIGIFLLLLIQYTYLLSSISDILSTAFRSPRQYFTPIYLLSLSLILTVLLKRAHDIIKDKKNISILFMVLIVLNIIYISPVFMGNPLQKSWIVRVPQEYYDTANFLNQQDEDFRILPLPLSQHFTGYTPYKWNYTGPDVIYELLNKPLIDKHVSMVASDEYLGIIKKLEKSNDKDIIQLAKKLNVKYILLRNDVDMNHPFYIRLINSPNFYKKILDNSSEIKNIYIFGNLTLYEIEGYYPKIFEVPVDPSIKEKNISNIYNQTFYKFQNVKYLHIDNVYPTINNSQKFDIINSFNFSTEYMLEKKTNTTGDWRDINHVVLQSNILKVDISPYGLIYVFIYLKNGTFIGLAYQIDVSDIYDKTKLDIIYDDNMIYFYKNNELINHTSIPREQIYNITNTNRVGSNFGNSEKMKGKIYNMNFILNNKTIINRSILSGYNLNKMRDSIKTTSVPSYKKLNWTKISPTKYKIDIHNEDSRKFFILFLETYSPNWKAYINNGKSVHVKFFDYANGWYMNKPGNYTVTIEYEPQRLYDMGLIISIFSLLIMISLLIIPDHILPGVKKFLKEKLL
jgi:Alpha-(1->3)-arabinofuranosyltransferase